MMGLEQAAGKDKALSLYRERAFAYVDRVANKIRKIVSGEIKKIHLSEQEKKSFFQFEKSLGEKLEKIHALNPSVMTLYLNFFATAEGKSCLKEFTGLELNSSDPDEIRKFLYSNSNALVNLDGKKRDDLSGKTISFADDNLLQDLWRNRNENGEININRRDIPVQQRFQIVVSPEEALEKIIALRKFKKEQISGYRANLKKESSPSQLNLAKMEILDAYLRKVNVMIAEQYKFSILTFEKKKVLPHGSLTDTDQKLLEQFSGLLSPQRNQSRIDRMFYGASGEYDEKGMRKPISKELLDYAEKIAEAGEKAILSRSEQIKQGGLDEKKLFERNVSPQQRATFHEEILASENLLSAYPSEMYKPGRNEPAPDNKWQHALRPNRSSMKLGPAREKVLLDSNKELSSIYEALAVACGHENVHILRVENMSKIPLRLTQKIGGSRIAALSEGGSMHIQNKICETIFGFSDLPHSHYLRAMIRKMGGANYPECIKAFYSSSVAITKKKLADGLIAEAEFEKEAFAKLKEAINRSKRLFSDGVSFESSSPYLTDSRSTVYLEQKYLLEKLGEIGLQKLAYVGGVDLDDVCAFLKLNLINFEDVEEYDMEAVRKIWEREKPKYLLNHQS
jgi:hypothetical protein